MKYVCLGYMAEDDLHGMSESERNRMIDACFGYDDELRAGGHFTHGEALHSAQSSTTLRWNGRQVSVTDGPFAETKEQLGGIIVLEARDLNHAIQLMSKHPSIPFGTLWEIRPAADLTALLTESAERRGVEAPSA